METDRFQGLCLASEDGAGAKYIYMYDQFPPQIRELIRNSTANICMACLHSISIELRAKDRFLSQEGALRMALYKMEAQVRENKNGV